MSVTLGELVGQVRHKLSGVGAIEDASAELALPINATDKTITLDDAQGFSRGVCEIDFEQLRIKMVDESAKTLTLPTYGRGYKGTLPIAHAQGTEVIFNPLWPKGTIAREINGVLHELYPDLYAVRVLTTTVPQNGLPVVLPATAVGVISVWLGEDGSWLQNQWWDFQPDSNPDGRGLLLGYGRYGQGLRVVYAERPGAFALNSTAPQGADFTTATGLDERVADLVALGVAARLAPFLPLARLVVAGAEARADGAAKPVDSLNSSAKLLYSEFRARVQAEKDALVREHPIRLHKVGR